MSKVFNDEFCQECGTYIREGSLNFENKTLCVPCRWEALDKVWDKLIAQYDLTYKVIGGAAIVGCLMILGLIVFIIMHIDTYLPKGV